MNSKTITKLALAGLSAGLLGCSAMGQKTAPPEADPVIQAPAALQKDAFAFALLQDQAAANSSSGTRSNILLSPASLENVIGILREGARGTTRAAIDKVPMGQRGVKSAMRVESADALFVDSSLPLLPVLVKDVQRLSFADSAGAAKTINRWCKDKTHGCIPEMVGAGDFQGTDPTGMVVANAVYLKEKWLRPFKSDATRPGTFHQTNGGTADVDMMHQTADFRYAEGADWQAVVLFYRTDGRAGESGCFIGILPKGDATKFAAGLTAEKFNGIRRALAQAKPEPVQVTLPKMEMRTPTGEAKDTLTDTLKRTGLGILFERGKADFSGFSASPEPLYVRSVRQRCYVKVDEKKTEAAAITIVDIPVQCIELPTAQPRVITFDRPFVWVIGDLTTGAAPWFIGVCEHP